MKTCIKCHKLKPLAEFYSHPQMRDGRLNKCKECVKIDVRANRAESIDYYREYDKERAMKPHRVAAREAYAQTERGKEVGRRVKRDWAKRNPEKRAAHVILGNAVRDGRIEKPGTCGRCGKGGRIHAHHEDYALPLKVEWLCAACHRQEHKHD